MRRKRVVIPVASTVVVAVVLGMLVWFELLSLRSAQGTFSMAPALPACNGQVVADGFTYRLRNPRRGEIVVFHARGQIGANVDFGLVAVADSDDVEARNPAPQAGLR
jgi:hypothetical protein